MRLLTFISIFAWATSIAITQPTQLLRACIDNDNMQVTVSWNPPKDACNSFTEYKLYGSEDGGAFQLIATIPDITISEYPHSLSSININWRYYLTTFSTCNGIDSTISDTLSIDVTYPEDIELDSVSYDYHSQHIIAGWTSNSSPDTDGYQIYNFSSGDGDSIGYTNNTFYTIATDPNNRFPVVIATLDSCQLSSLLSRPHIPSFLNSTIDTCLNEISLNWTLYSGWNQIDSQVIFYSINSAPHTRLLQLGSSTTTFTFNNFTLGDSIDFYIRTYSENKTSSSNRVRLETRKHIIPDYIYIDYASVNQNEVDLQWQSFPSGDIAQYDIKRSVDGTSYNTISTVNGTISNFTDFSVNPSNSSYTYNLVAYDKCDQPLDSANLSETIHLSLTPELNHNPYVGWENDTELYELEFSEDRSTWNVIEASTNSIQLNEVLESGCYRIKATEKQNSLNQTNVSYSNVVCKLDSLKVFVTESINPNSSNNRFAIYGTGIDHENSTYEIFNRWGEKLVSQRTDEVWTLDYDNKSVQAGVYLYIVTIHGELGERKIIKGTIHVLR